MPSEAIQSFKANRIELVLQSQMPDSNECLSLKTQLDSLNQNSSLWVSFRKADSCEMSHSRMPVEQLIEVSETVKAWNKIRKKKDFSDNFWRCVLGEFF